MFIFSSISLINPSLLLVCYSGTFVKPSRWSGREQGDTFESEGSPMNQPDSVVVWNIILLGYSLVGTTSSAEAKLLCCLILDKSILEVVVLEDSQSLVICASCWDDTRQVWRMFTSCRKLLSHVHQYTDIVKMILLSWYYLFGTENTTVTLLPWVEIPLCILSEALIILLFICPEVIRGFYWLELRVDLLVLHRLIKRRMIKASLRMHRRIATQVMRYLFHSLFPKDSID